MKNKPLVDKITNDDTKLIITNKSVKWILGIIGGSVVMLGSLAWGLYTNVDNKVTVTKKELVKEMENSHDKIMRQLEKMEDVDIKDNTTKNYQQDTEIGILIERTNSRNTTINQNTPRPSNTNQDLPE